MTPENPSPATPRDWYPVARAVDLDRPRQVTLLGRRLVAFRTADGRPRVLPDRCQHRGGALHRGAVIGDSIECPYHGWQWRGADGQCVYIPSNGPSAPIPKAAVIGAFPAVEHYGLIWTCIADPLTGPRSRWTRTARYELRDAGSDSRSALTNTAKHAQASEVNVTADTDDANLRLSIRDDESTEPIDERVRAHRSP